jgi:hypothetical protein
MALVPLPARAYDSFVKLATLNTKPLPTKPLVPITGILGLLPAELVDAVCAAVLRVDSSWFDAFTRTCRGVRRSVSPSTAIEFVVRRCSYMLPGPALVAKTCSYTEHMKLKMRNRLELYSLSALFDCGATHCVSPNQACCRDRRRRLQSKPLDMGAGVRHKPHTLLDEAIAGRASCRVDVAAQGRALILCGTPAGAVIREGDDVRLATSRRAEVFVPGRELASVHLATTARAEARGAAVWAAAEGDRVAVCLRDPAHPSRYTVKLWGEHGRDFLGEHTLEPVTLGVPLLNVVRMFMRKGAVWLMLTRILDFHDEELQFVRVVIGNPCSTLLRRTVLGIMASVSVATASGHVAFLESDRQEQGVCTERVVVFDPDLVQTHRITEAFEVGEYSGEPNVLAIAPNGRVIVMLMRDRAEDSPFHRGHPVVVIYQREGDATAWKVRVNGELSLLNDAGPTQWGWDALRGGPISDMVFSPSGDTLLVMVAEDQQGDDELSSGIIAFNVEEALRLGRILKIGTKFATVGSGYMPTQLVWSDGIFLCMAGDEGVARVGLSA